MTDKEIRKLRRRDLLEMLIEAEKKNQALAAENEELLRQKEAREICISKAGSIAEAALQLNGIFEAAQQAAGQYLDNLRRISEEPEKMAESILAKAEKRAKQIEEEAEKKAEKIINAASKRAEAAVTEAAEEGDCMEAEKKHD